MANGPLWVGPPSNPGDPPLIPTRRHLATQKEGTLRRACSIFNYRELSDHRRHHFLTFHYDHIYSIRLQQNGSPFCNCLVRETPNGSLGPYGRLTIAQNRSRRLRLRSTFGKRASTSGFLITLHIPMMMMVSQDVTDDMNDDGDKD